MTVIRRLDAMLEGTIENVRNTKKLLDEAKVDNQWPALCNAAGQPFCNASPFLLKDLTSRASKQKLKTDFETYLDGFSPNVQEILEKFKFRNQIATMVDADILGSVIEKFVSSDINLSPNPVYKDDEKTILKHPGLDNHGMGTIFEELIRKFNEENNEEAGEHWTPRDVVELMADLIFIPIADQIKDATYTFGKDENDKSVVYIGQAGVRKNGEGILNRLVEHNRNPKKDYWTEAIALTTSNDSLGPTEISYLEHQFYQLAVKAKRYDVKNDNDPTPGNISEEKESELDEFIEYAKVIVGTLGHKVFVPLLADNNDGENTTSESIILYCTRNGINSIGVRTSDGFVVKKGSIISQKITKSCPDYVLKKRTQHKNIIDANNMLTEDILFNTPSGASSFACGASTNGNIEWKTSEGITLKSLNEQGK